VAGAWPSVTVLSVLLGVSACGSRNPASPDPSDPFVGTWTGSIVDDRFGGGTFRLVITGNQRDGRLPSGEWSATFPNALTTTGGAPPYAPQPDGSIMIFGSCSVSGSVGFRLEREGTELRGSYVALGCGVLSIGTLALVKP
jgi:hypothetical protein